MNNWTYYIQHISNQIEQAVNRKIKGFPDTIWLANQFEERNLFISGHTLARVFGVIPNNNKPYKTTLDTLARFLQYENWDTYLQLHAGQLTKNNFFLSENASGFSEVVLELALVTKNYDELHRILLLYNSYELNEFHFHIANLIGLFVQENRADDVLLEVLAKSRAGQSLFYGCFVDEENKDNYFSNALLRYYLPNVPTIESQIFVNTYCLAQALYKSEKVEPYINDFQKIMASIDLKKSHYHLVSRILECEILLLKHQDDEKNKLKKILDKIIFYSKIYKQNEWIVARSLRALLHCNYKESISTNEKLKALLRVILFKNQAYNYSAALYIIQLYWLFNSEDKKIEKYKPIILPQTYLQNNKPERKAIELATALRFSKGKNHQLIKQHLFQYCEENNLSWIKNTIT